MTSPKKTIDTLLEEKRLFPPSTEFTSQANINQQSVVDNANNDWESWWASWAEKLTWEKKWHTTLEWNEPFAKWFEGGKINASVQCLDRHIDQGLGSRIAYYWEGEPGDSREITYKEMLDGTCQIANALKELNITKGDRVTFYMPMVPELAMAVLACSRIGAIFSVVFAGFSATSLKDRINDQEAKLVICADATWRRGKILDLKSVVDDAVQECPTVKNVLVYKRGGSCTSSAPKKERDIEWDKIVNRQDKWCQPTSMDSEDPLFILYTSGTTGKPKGILHTTGGYLTGTYTTSQLVFDLKPEKDIYWCTADIGWITGHSYIIFGPMANGVTQVMYEGAPNHPKQDRFWKIIDKYKVSIFYTAPTAIRAFMKWGDEHPAAHDLSSLRLLGTVGEPINPEAWVWYAKHIGNDACPIVDTWWQTETGSIMITPLPGITKTIPGSATTPFPGVEAVLVDDEGNEIQGAGGGYLTLTHPWPSMLRGIWGDPERYRETYWSRFQGKYFAGDGAKRDENGNLWILGRVDDVMNVSGHRLSTMEIESSLVAHKSVAEAAVIGINHEIKGQAPVGFVILRNEQDATDVLAEELRKFVAEEIGGLARPENIYFTPELPKTRSGKIMRRLLRDIAEGKPIGDLTTLADPSILNGLIEEYKRRNQ
jgi:acetyl-CoA synthetase